MKKTLLLSAVSLAFALTLSVTTISCSSPISEPGSNLSSSSSGSDSNNDSEGGSSDNSSDDGIDPSVFRGLQNKKIDLSLLGNTINSSSEVWLLQVNKSNNSTSTIGFSADTNGGSRSAFGKNFSAFDLPYECACSDNIPEFVKEWRTKEIVIPVDGVNSRNAGSVYKASTSLSANDEKPFIEDGKTYRYFYVKQEYIENSGKVTRVQKYKAEKVKTGTYSTVWYVPDSELGTTVDNAMEAKIRQNLLKLADVFDEIYPMETNLLGSEKLNNSLLEKFWGTPCNEKNVDILVYDISEDKLEAGGHTLGYFYSGDIDPVEKDSVIPSNHSLMFHIDSYYLGEEPATIYSTIVHEFNHLLNYVNKTYNLTKNENGMITLVPLSSWFTEMLSAMAEDVMYKNCLEKYSNENSVQKMRIPEFLRDYVFGFKKWNAYECYGCVYGYGAYLLRNYASENGGGKGISLLHEIATNGYFNEEAITNALQTVTGNSSITYESTLPYYPVVLTNNYTGSNISLNKSVSERIGGYNYQLTAIDIFNGRRGSYLYEFGRHNHVYDTNFYPMGVRIDKVPSDIVSNKGIIKCDYDESTLQTLYVSVCVKNDTELTIYPVNW